MSPEDIPGFDRDPELDKLLTRNVGEMDEETRLEVQTYKSRILKAKRDAGVSGEKPEWWGGGPAPETVAETGSAGEAAPAETEQEPEPEPAAEQAEAEESAEQAEEAEEPEPEAEEEAPAEQETPAESRPAAAAETPSVDTSSIPGFDSDPELDKLLTRNVGEMDEETRLEVQTYKSRLLKALRDAGQSGDRPPWWASDRAPETVEETDQEGAQPVAAEEPAEPEESAEAAPEQEEPEPEPVAEEEPAEAVEEEEPEKEPVAAESPEPEEEPEKQAPPPEEEKKYRGERKIKELVGARTTGREVTRRGFISSFALGTLGFLGTLGVGSAAAGRFFFPNVLENPPEQFIAGDPSDYPTNTVSDKYKGQYRVWIVNLGDRLVSILAICTHLGCTPNWLESQGIFKCPCHGSGYYMNGVNFEGPAPRPMDRVGIRLNPDGKVVVDKSQLFAANEQPGWEAKSAYIPV